MTESLVALDLEVPSDIRQVERVVSLARDLCRTLNLPEKVCTLNVPVALSEAVSNAIMRGNKEDKDKLVRIKALVDDCHVIFDVIDEGAGFDIDESFADPRLDSNIEREGGRGLFLMLEFMDQVEQFRSEGRNVVRLTLNR